MPIPAPLRHSPPLAEELHVRDMEESDAERTAHLHREHLSLGLFPRLGPRFMARWHQTFVTSSHAWGGVVEGPDGDVVAMALVTTDQSSYLREAVTVNRWPLARAGAVGLLRDPWVLLHFLRTRALRYWRRIRSADRVVSAEAADAPARLGVVHAVVTAEGARGRGCARALLEAAEDHARRSGTAVLALVTEHPDVDHALGTASGAAAMYDHLGWERTGVRIREGRRIAEYRRHLSPGGGDLPARNESSPR